jgi:dienelactone hydrolase
VGDVRRTHLSYQVEAGVRTEAYLLMPLRVKRRVPGVVVFHSTTHAHIRQPAGLEDTPEKHLGLMLARRGFAALCPRCFLWDNPDHRFEQRVVEMRQRHPGWTGMRKMLWDAQRAVDILSAQEGVDPRRIGAAGHSLGAKETLYLAALDSRVRCSVFSEGGVAVSSSNWNADWYLGRSVEQAPRPMEHHELLAMVAPRPFLVIGGESADTRRTSGGMVAAALPAWRAMGAAEELRYFGHSAGHALPPEALGALDAWLCRGLQRY